MQAAIEYTFDAFEPDFVVPAYIDFPLLSAFADYQGINDMEEAVEQYEDCYAGTFASAETWAENLLDETGELNEIPERLRYYFDYALYARDCLCSGDIWTLETSSGVAIFWNR